MAEVGLQGAQRNEDCEMQITGKGKAVHGVKYRMNHCRLCSVAVDLCRRQKVQTQADSLILLVSV